jgi:hypothetical protein
MVVLFPRYHRVFYQNGPQRGFWGQLFCGSTQTLSLCVQYKNVQLYVWLLHKASGRFPAGREPCKFISYINFCPLLLVAYSNPFICYLHKEHELNTWQTGQGSPCRSCLKLLDAFKRCSYYLVVLFCEISGSHSNGYEGACLLGCCAM